MFAAIQIGLVNKLCVCRTWRAYSALGNTDNGNYWSSTANSDATNAYNLNYNTSNTNPQNNNNKANGNQVRCVAI